MIQEEKELLLKYLCMALPYGVKCHFKYGSAEDDITLSCIDNNVARFEYGWCGRFHVSIDADYIKPYLRPMSSMIEEEEEELRLLKNKLVDCDENNDEKFYRIINEIHNLYLSHHIDFIGLIPKGLAIEVTESNNPYK